MSIQTRLQTPNPLSTAKWPELSLGVSPSPLGGSCWFTSCVLAMDSTRVASVLTFRCQKFERALTNNVLACDFCVFPPKPSAPLIISCCHNHHEGLLKSLLSQHSLATHSLLHVRECYRQKATHLGQILSQEMKKKARLPWGPPTWSRKEPQTLHSSSQFPFSQWPLKLISWMGWHSTQTARDSREKVMKKSSLA